MLSPDYIAYEISVLVETFNIRWDLHRDVAKQFKRCSPDIQREVISKRMPLIVRNPNAFVISRIRKSNYSRSELRAPRDSGEVAGPEESCPRVGHPNRSISRSRSRSQASSRKQKSDVVDVSESSPSLSEKASTTPPADYMDGSDGDKGAMLTIAPKKLPKNSVKKTLCSKCMKK